MDNQVTQTQVNLRGGKRESAGRKLGTGKFKEATTVVRMPASQLAVVKDFLAAYQRKKLSADLDVVGDIALPALNALAVKLPLYSSKVSAGFPSPAEEHVEKRLDPSEFLIDQKDATFFVTIQGLSMMDVGLLPGDRFFAARQQAGGSRLYYLWLQYHAGVCNQKRG